MSQAEPSSNVRVPHYCLTTKEFAAEYRVKEQTVRKNHSKTGAHCGVRPLVLPNKRLRWPDRTLELLAAEKLGAKK